MEWLKLLDCFAWLLRTKKTDRISSLPNEILRRIFSFLTLEETIRTTVLSRQWRKVTDFDFFSSTVSDFDFYECYDEDTADRLSSLPYDIRVHILSFLTLEETVRTTILSRQWRKLSISNFDFYELEEKYYYRHRYQSQYNHKPFWRIVTKSLHRYCNLDLGKLNIDIIYDDRLAPRICEWVAFAFTHNVSELKIFLYAQTLVVPPSSCFTCKTLTKLSLRNMKLKSPKTVYFPNLKTLMLVFVDFLQETEAIRFFSSFPVLEYLKLVRCHVKVDTRIFTISTPKLKFFHLEHCWIDSEIVISSTTLKEIKYNGYPILHRYYLNNLILFGSISPLSTLSHATFKFYHPPPTIFSEITEIAISGTLKILESLSNVVKLELMGYFFQYLTREPNLFNRLPLPSYSVKHLELEMCSTNNQYQIVTSVLTIYPNLQMLRVFIMDEPYMFVNDVEVYTRAEISSKDGILNNLKTVEVEGFKGDEAEIDIVRFLLENARNMEKMDISLKECRIPIEAADETMRARHYIKVEEKFRNFVKTYPNVRMSMW